MARLVTDWLGTLPDQDPDRRETLRQWLRHELTLEADAPDLSRLAPVDRSSLRHTGAWKEHLGAVKRASLDKAEETLAKRGVQALLTGATEEELTAALDVAGDAVYCTADRERWLPDVLAAYAAQSAEDDRAAGERAVRRLAGTAAKDMRRTATRAYEADVTRAEKAARYAGQDTPYSDLSERTFNDALERIGAAIRWNEMTNGFDLSRDGGVTWIHMDDALEARLRTDLENRFRVWVGKKVEGLHWPEVKWGRLREAHGALPQWRHHPIRDWLEGLRGRWDGVKRLDAWLAEAFKPWASADPFLAWGSKYIIMAAVRRTFNPGAKADEMPILKGAAGLGKSTVLRCLIPAELRAQGFSDSLTFQDSNPARWAELLEKAVIVEAEECVGISRSKVDAVKKFVGGSNDDRALKYQTHKKLLPRRCVIVGTLNPSRTLPLDPENRKLIVLELDLRTHARSAVGPIEGWLEAEVAPGLSRRDALWAEAVHRVDAGEEIAFPPHLMSQLMERTSAHADGEHYGDAIAALPNRDPDTGLRWQHDALLYALFADCPDAAAPSSTDEEKTIPFSPKRLTVPSLNAIHEALRRDGWTRTIVYLSQTNPDGTQRRYKQHRWVRECYEHEWRERVAAEAAAVLPRLAQRCPGEGMTLEEIVPELPSYPRRIQKSKRAASTLDAIHARTVVREFRRDFMAAVRRAGWRKAGDLRGHSQRFLPPTAVGG